MTKENFCLIRSVYISSGMQFEKLKAVLESGDNLINEDVANIEKAKDMAWKIQDQLSEIVENDG